LHSNYVNEKLILLFAHKFTNVLIVITKGGGKRPCETLATLFFFKLLKKSRCYILPHPEHVSGSFSQILKV